MHRRRNVVKHTSREDKVKPLGVEWNFVSIIADTIGEVGKRARETSKLSAETSSAVIFAAGKALARCGREDPIPLPKSRISPGSFSFRWSQRRRSSAIFARAKKAGSSPVIAILARCAVRYSRA